MTVYHSKKSLHNDVPYERVMSQVLVELRRRRTVTIIANVSHKRVMSEMVHNDLYSLGKFKGFYYGSQPKKV